MLQCNLSARVLFPEAWKRPVQAPPLMTVRELAAARGAAADDLLFHRPVCRGRLPVQALPLMTVRELAAARGAAAARGVEADDLVFHRPVCRGSSRDLAAQGRASTRARMKL